MYTYGEIIYGIVSDQSFCFAARSAGESSDPVSLGFEPVFMDGAYGLDDCDGWFGVELSGVDCISPKDISGLQLEPTPEQKAKADTEIAQLYAKLPAWAQAVIDPTPKVWILWGSS